MKTPILGGSYVARSVNAADSRMVNLFPEGVPEGGKEPAFLNRAPGLRLLATVGDGPIRGLWRMGDYGYVVSGKELYRLNSDWTSLYIGNLSGTGPVSIADNGTQMFIACNGPSFIYNSTTEEFAQIADADFPGAVTVGYLDGYFVFNEPNSQKVWVTSLLDGTAIDPLEFASAEGSPDQLVAAIVDHREAWLFGTNSIEVWYDAGSADFPLQRIQGAFNEIGLAAAYSVAKLDNGLFWLGADSRGQGIVYRSNGYTGKRISTHAVEWQIQQYGDISDAIGYTYQQDGHAFYVLVFPSEDTTWVYDVSTELWHERCRVLRGSVRAPPWKLSDGLQRRSGHRGLRERERLCLRPERLCRQWFDPTLASVLACAAHGQERPEPHRTAHPPTGLRNGCRPEHGSGVGPAGHATLVGRWWTHMVQ